MALTLYGFCLKTKSRKHPGGAKLVSFYNPCSIVLRLGFCPIMQFDLWDLIHIKN